MSDEILSDGGIGEFDDLWSADDESAEQTDRSTVITLLSGGSPVYVDLPEGQETMTVTEVVQASGLYVAGSPVFYVDGQPVAPTTNVGAGAEIRMAASTKGG